MMKDTTGTALTALTSGAISASNRVLFKLRQAHNTARSAEMRKPEMIRAELVKTEPQKAWVRIKPEADRQKAGELPKALMRHNRNHFRAAHRRPTRALR